MAREERSVIRTCPWFLRRPAMRRLIVTGAGALSLAMLLSVVQYRAEGQSAAGVTPADYIRWRTELRNWGRWGPDDQKGVSNLITSAKVQAAARLVNAGVVVS